MQMKPISIQQSGQTIRGTFYRAGDTLRRRPVVVFLHGFTGNRHENDDMFVRLARGLADQGIHALTFDFRGSGESDGRFDQMLVSSELADALRVLEWVGGQPGVDRSRIGLLGFSLGGLLACCTAARFSSIKALALLAPTTGQNLRRYVEGQEQEGPVIVGSRSLHPQFFDDLETLDSLADAVKNPRPTLLIHGTADKSVPPAVGQQYAKALQGAGLCLQLEWIDGANHVFSGQPARQKLLSLVAGFFKERLGG